MGEVLRVKVMGQSWRLAVFGNGVAPKALRQAHMLTLGAQPGGGGEEARLVGRLHGGTEKEKTPATEATGVLL